MYQRIYVVSGTFLCLIAPRFSFASITPCNKVLETAPTPDQVFEHLLRAMHRPMLGAGRACRPKMIYLDNPDHVAELTPHLSALEIGCKYRSTLPVIDRTLTSLEKV